jgi:hypothetical protein
VCEGERCMYIWLRMESGEMGEGMEEMREVVGRLTRVSRRI